MLREEHNTFLKPSKFTFDLKQNDWNALASVDQRLQIFVLRKAKNGSGKQSSRPGWREWSRRRARSFRSSLFIPFHSDASPSKTLSPSHCASRLYSIMLNVTIVWVPARLRADGMAVDTVRGSSSAITRRGEVYLSPPCYLYSIWYFS